jgi:hemoglobin-like flavoprotein/uncharacterized protein YjbI with pentapeptide repeats
MSLNVEILEQSFEMVKPHANEFAASFYDNLFTVSPEVKPLFAQTDMLTQQKKLLNSLVLVVENLRNPDALAPVLNALGARHISYGAIPQYYEPVGAALLMTFAQYLQEDFTPEVKQAWLDAFTAIASLMLKGAGVEAQPVKVELQISHDSEAQAIAESSELAEVTQEILQVEILEREFSDLPVDLLESSFQKVKPYANEFASSFYENLFKAYPEMKPLFAKTDMVTQHKKLLSSLVLVVENLRNPEALEPVLNALGSRHISYGAIPKYYEPVVKSLLVTFEQYLQDDWNPEIQKAWRNALRAISALMLKGAGQESSSTAVSANKPEALVKTGQILKEPVTLAKSSTLSPKSNSKFQQESQIVESSIEKEKKPLILIQLDGEILKEILKNYTSSYQQIQTKITEQPLTEVIKQVPKKFVDAFWNAPTWLIAIISTVVFTVIIVSVDENSWMGKALGGGGGISLVLALVLFIKESPDRRKQFHYQAWSTIDSAHNVKVSYARILALQDLNEDGVSLRGLDAPSAELVDIHLPHANLSKANLQECDLSNANLSYANLDNANLLQTKLSGANLSHAKLGFAVLSQANLNSANLSNANLICADLSNANLSGANLKDASLSGANLNGAYLTGANLKNAKVSDFELSSAFLEGAIMPDGSRYKSPVSEI